MKGESMEFRKEPSAQAKEQVHTNQRAEAKYTVPVTAHTPSEVEHPTDAPMEHLFGKTRVVMMPMTQAEKEADNHECEERDPKDLPGYLRRTG
jgi:hypothetical protein